MAQVLEPTAPPSLPVNIPANVTEGWLMLLVEVSDGALGVSVGLLIGGVLAKCQVWVRPLAGSALSEYKRFASVHCFP